MKMNNFKELDAYHLDRFSYENLEWNIAEDVLVQVEYLYRDVFLKTNNKDLLIAREYCDVYRFQVSQKPKSDTAKTITVYTEKHPLVQRVHKSLKTDYDPSYNCFGAAVLDKKYFLSLDSNNLKCFLDGDGYKEVKKRHQQDHLVVYYKQNMPIHIARYDDIKKVYEHKIGYRSEMCYYKTDNIKQYCDYNRKKYFIKG